LIEVNLLPGGKKRQSRGSKFQLSMPSFGGRGGSKFDGWMIGSAATIVLALGAMSWMFFGARSTAAELEVAIEDAVRDSARYADLIQKTEGLRARRDSIGQKVAIIQQIDSDRYIWSHILDEVSRSLPDYTWLTQLVQVSAGDGFGVEFRIEGRAGNTIALTRFMESLEASPFIRDVALITSEQITETGEDGANREVHQFTLNARFDDPPGEMIETVPLFSAASGGEVIVP